MANGVVVQFAVIAVFAAILLGLLAVFRMRKVRRELSGNVREAPVPMMSDAEPRVNRIETFVSVETEKVENAESLQPEATPIFETANSSAHAARMDVTDTTSARVSAIPTEAIPDANPEIVVHAKPLSTPEDRNQRILAGISENIRKNLIKPVPTYSPIQYSETQRETEYVRVKKKILTPHGQVRFSILKDSVSNNMLAIFRRFCMEWKTPKDLIAFLPPYLEYEAEILDNQLLLIGTAGHNEKLAIPIRRVDPGSGYFGFFEFVTDDRTAVNTPAVLLLTDDEEYAVVSRGVIVQPVFFGPAERNHTEVRLLVEKSFAIGTGGTALPT